MNIHTASHAIALLVLISIGQSFAAPPVTTPGPSSPVQVTNTSANSIPVTIASPLPLPITGQATVSGTVAATQSGTWNVNVTGNANGPGSSPFQQTVTFSANPPSACRAIPTSPQVCDFQFPAVPAGKRLVVTNVSGMLFVDGPGAVGAIQFFPGPTIGALFLGTYPNTSNGGTENMFGLNAPVLFYVEAQTSLGFRVNASAPVAIDNNGTVTSSITVSGYFVSL
jgi:hypothetical protein